MTDIVVENSEALFKTLEQVVAQNARLLYKQRDRVRRKEEDHSWPGLFQSDFKELKEKVEQQLLADNIHRFTKLLKLTLSVIEGFTIQHHLTKIPSPPVNYLEIDLEDYHISWILKHLKVQWIRFNQFYWQLWLEEEMRKES